VPRDITVTASPRRDQEATLSLTERLCKENYRVVPHLSARLVADAAHLSEIVARLKSCGVEDLFVPAGTLILRSAATRTPWRSSWSWTRSGGRSRTWA
jgi:hypothetical protein